MVKRILILTAGFGEGHNAAARGLRDALARLGPAAAEVEMHDLFAETYGIANEWTRRLYLAVINHWPVQWSAFYQWLDRRQTFDLRMFFWARNRLAALLARFRPDVIVCVYPAYPYMLAEILGDSGSGGARRVVVVTDSLTVNAIWHRAAADYFFVPNALTADVMRAASVPEEKLRDFGFPVNPRFAEEETAAPEAADAPRRILLMISSGKSTAPDLVRRLAALPNTELTVTSGRDETLRARLEQMRAESGLAFEVVGWSDEMPRLMRRSHLLISKAGGATVQETIAAGCPLIINQVVPGQEEGNARLIEQTRSGRVAGSDDEVVAAVEAAFADGAALWQEWAANIRAQSRPGAALEAARFLTSL